MPGDAAVLSEKLGAAPGPADPADAGDDGFGWMLLARHGRRPARFLGREMLRADSRAAARAGFLPLWSDIKIFELYEGGFVIAVRHRHTADDACVFQDAWPVQDPCAVLDQLRAHDIAAAVQGAAYICDATAARAWQALIAAIFGAQARA